MTDYFDVIGGISDVVLCIPHRGRLNLLTGLLEYPLPVILLTSLQYRDDLHTHTSSVPAATPHSALTVLVRLEW